MGMDFDDEQLMRFLLKFVTSMPIQCDQIRLVDLYGNKKPSQLFDTTSTNHHHYVFTQLKKIKGNGKNFNRGIVGGGGSWKGVDTSKPVYDKKGLVIGFKKTFRFDEKKHVWIMKEYRPSDSILKALRLRGQIRHEEEFSVCRITRSANSDRNGENLLASCVPISSSQFQETVKSENQDLGRSSAANVISNGNISPVCLVLKESNVPAAKEEEECSVPVVHQETASVSLLAKESNVTAAKDEECSVRPDYDIATYHQELDAYAASVLETMIPYIPEPQEDEADSIPLFCEDFYIGYTDLWS
ncbi:protein FEZ-like [Solanum dulcamara]|uniref:protein FEZ-like n=1 Tax=Solanum dulcamara TaxID=45834 RepID=UPI0024862944|nr:protein FEZ-like [Solanum dulcamara]